MPTIKNTITNKSKAAYLLLFFIHSPYWISLFLTLLATNAAAQRTASITRKNEVQNKSSSIIPQNISENLNQYSLFHAQVKTGRSSVLPLQQLIYNEENIPIIPKNLSASEKVIFKRLHIITKVSDASDAEEIKQKIILGLLHARKRFPGIERLINAYLFSEKAEIILVNGLPKQYQPNLGVFFPDNNQVFVDHNHSEAEKIRIILEEVLHGGINAVFGHPYPFVLGDIEGEKLFADAMTTIINRVAKIKLPLTDNEEHIFKKQLADYHPIFVIPQNKSNGWIDFVPWIFEKGQSYSAKMFNQPHLNYDNVLLLEITRNRNNWEFTFEPQFTSVNQKLHYALKHFKKLDEHIYKIKASAKTRTKEFATLLFVEGLWPFVKHLAPTKYLDYFDKRVAEHQVKMSMLSDEENLASTSSPSPK